MSEATLLTLLSIDSGEQRHFEFQQGEAPKQFFHWLLGFIKEGKHDSHQYSIEPLMQGALLKGGKLVNEMAGGMALHKYLITIHTAQDRILISAWSRQDEQSGWERKWLPRRLEDQLDDL